jgi:hypothetical protein
MHTCIWRLTYLLLSSNYCTFLPLFSGLFALFLPTSFAKSLVYNCSFLPPGSFDRRSGFRHVVFVNQNLSPVACHFLSHWSLSRRACRLNHRSFPTVVVNSLLTDALRDNLTVYYRVKRAWRTFLRTIVIYVPIT